MTLLLFAPWLACSESGTATDTQAADQAPVADAGPDLTAALDERVTLDGGGSYDPEGADLAYEWFLDHVPDGSALAGAGPEAFSVNGSTLARTTTFLPDALGTWVVGLQVWDGHQLGGPDYAVIEVEEATHLPVADAGPDQVVDLGDTVTLDGSGSYDPLGRPLAYDWSLVSAAPGSVLTTADIQDVGSATPSFVPDHRGTYVLSLVVDNGQVRSEADSVSVEVLGANTPPLADAGADVTGEDCTPIILNGTGSSDPEGDPLEYWWTIQAWPDHPDAVAAATLDDPASPTPTFFTSVEGTYLLSLSVFDGEAWSDPDLVEVDLVARATNSPPSIVVNTPADPPMQDVTCKPSGATWTCPDCPDQAVTLGDTITVSDADGDPLTYLWTVRTGDATIDDPSSLVTQATLSGLETLNVGVCTDTRFVFSLTVTDCTGASSTEQVQLTSTCCGLLP